MMGTVDEAFPEAKCQWYTIYFYPSGVFGHASRQSKTGGQDALRRSTPEEQEICSARKKAKAITKGMCSMKLKETAKKVEARIDAPLTYCEFPCEH